MRGSWPEGSPRGREGVRGGPASPTSGASEPSRGAHRGGSSSGSGHRSEDSFPNNPRPDEEGAPLLTMDAAIRELCERIRHRLDRLKGRTWNGRDAELDAELSSVEYDINGAEFLLKEIRAKLATSSTRNLPPVAAYRASLESSRRMLDAIRVGAGIAGEPRAHGGARGARPGGSRESMRGPSSSSGRGTGPLGRLWKGTVSFVKDLLEDPFLDPLLPPALLAAEAEKRRRGEVPETGTARDTAAAGERSMEYHVAAGYYGSKGARAGAREDDVTGGEEASVEKQRRRRRRNGKKAGTHAEGRDMSPVAEESSPRGVVQDRVTPHRVTPPSVDESRVQYAESAWDGDDQLVRQTRENADDEQAWVRALQGAGGGNKVGASYDTRRVNPDPTDVDLDVLVDRYKYLAARDDPMMHDPMMHDPMMHDPMMHDPMMLSDASPGSTPRCREEPPDDISRVREANDREEEVDAEASLRRELFTNSAGADSRTRSRGAPLRPPSGHPRSPFSGDAPPDGWVEEELMRGVGRLERGREMLTDAQRAAADANETGDAILGTLREQRDALIRSRAGMEGVKEDMKHNERLVNNMNSWTRMGVKSRRTPWG